MSPESRPKVRNWPNATAQLTVLGLAAVTCGYFCVSLVQRRPRSYQKPETTRSHGC
ncbi:hypothetical protein BU25DRAFT_412891 [Macroventuria anomochaeta]|uniref:Uncharacterized protein n=1 Tax=Macroventuria anomochaeta TaxID=301207 RepID=A0ACB6RTG9_9PLEO|nr:uncharacterized protein BU25DRAFT_412891 [Macroventuria anomochaeta]KAF2625083.1 hypothetical protein BU25DRAFT_412891 [Macroventuria anomochaeta]